MKIATWNVNSIKSRLHLVIKYLEDSSPDILLLQELKGVNESFPEQEIGDVGYNSAVWGQKTYNGVAILSKHPIYDITRGLNNNEQDPQARYIEAEISGIRIASIYLPNGNPIDSEKYSYKINWMDKLFNHVNELLNSETPFILGGDFNVCPTDYDVYDPIAMKDDAVCKPESRERFRSILNLGITEAFRSINPNEIEYSYWGYQGGAWQKNYGLRIDHLLLSPSIADRLLTCQIDKGPRSETKPSDHVPLECTFN